MPNEPTTFPILRDDEAQAFFGSDTAAIRRYQVLRAIHTTHATQREVARAFAISERTLRTIVRNFARHGSLDSLRSQRRALPKRADTQRSLLENVLQQALAEEPGAGGDRLWRRACQLLDAGGPALSRRTAYRILSEIRADRQNDAERMIALVRSALPMLLEDPPLALGTSPLAQHLLPGHSDSLHRGTLLQHALRQALARLRPAGPISSLERPWWPYLICSGEYEAGQSRVELQEQLMLSVSTYTRAKRHGLERISALVPSLLEHLLTLPAVQAAQHLPRSPGFVGRRDEQAYYAWRLQTEGYAALWGLPGCGKTALAAELAADGQRYGQTVVWHTCLPGAEATLVGIVERFGRAIAGMGHMELWNMLRDEQAQATPTDLLETLRQHFLRHPALVIIDNLDHAELPGCQPLFDLLHTLADAGSVRLLTISRQRPATDDWPPLSGLTQADARLLWGSAVPLPPQWNEVFAATCGLPALLHLLARTHRAQRAEQLGAWRERIGVWVRNTIWSQLLPAEALLAAALLICEHAGKPLLVETVAGAIGVPIETGKRLAALGFLSAPAGYVSVSPLLAHDARDVLSENQLLEPLFALLHNTRLHGEPESQPGQPQASVPALLPHNPDLLARLRAALEQSSAYLGAQGADADARRLAHELRQLQAALPAAVRPG